MKVGYSSEALFNPFTTSVFANPKVTRLGLTLIIVLMVISSPIFMLVNPRLSAASPSTDPTSMTAIPSSINQDGSDFTTQAAISSLSARPTNNIVNTNSFYDVVFLTATAGAIKTIQVTFPAGTTIPSGAFFNEAEKCVPGSDCTELTGTASKSGQTITYTVNNAVNVPVGTKIRLEFANINNPLQVSANYKVTVTTRDGANTIIDGPTQSAAYTIKQIGTNAIADGHITTQKIDDNAVTTPKLADNSITSTKPAESFMKRVTVFDDDAGHAVGWDPNGATTLFSISDPDASGFNTAYVGVTVLGGDCVTRDQFPAGTFQIRCSVPPTNGAVLNYLLVNLPANFV